MHCVVFEPDSGGHRLQFVRVLANELIRLGHELTVLLPHGGTEDVAVHFDELSEEVTRIPLQRKISVKSPLKAGQQKAELLRTILRRIAPDRCYVPYADGLYQAMGLSLRPRHFCDRNVAIEGLVMRGGWAYPSSNIRKRISNVISLMLLCRARFHHIHFLDQLAFDSATKIAPNLITRSSVIPEPVEPLANMSVAEARRLLDLPLHGKIILSAGAQDERKGADLLIRAFRAAQFPPDIFLLMQGRQSEKVRKILQAEAVPQIIHRDTYCNNEHFDALFRASDVVAAPHPRHIGSSGIVVRAAAAKKPIVASDWGWVGWAVQSHDLGLVCNVNDTREFSQVLRDTVLAPPTRFPRRASFTDYHTIENHLSCWTRNISGVDQNRLAVPAGQRIA